MTGLTERAVGDPPADLAAEIEHARRRWEESMLRQVDGLREAVRARPPQALAHACGGTWESSSIVLPFWGRRVRLHWPQLAVSVEDGGPSSIFDTAMLLYYLRTADGAAMADRWIGFRELPDGAFYHLAYQRYSGDRLVRAFGSDGAAFDDAGRALQGLRLPALAEHAFAFQPLPRIRLAALLWPGDDEFPARGSILFDAAASHYMTTDGLALLGGGLAGRMEKAGSPKPPPDGSSAGR
ncbi:MAG: hypothetical protein A2Y93_12845 [Chloroflexi bacterium RBG_13_68_17]|nr:MAG: hypothetical protein A2Y93_12845 [Chloroflexi bacterium RBG_13_68_17]